MVNEIKLDAATVATALAKSNRKDLVAKSAGIPEESMTITNNLGTLLNKMVADNKVPDNQQRIIELKQQIQNNQYRVDTDKLASKLTHSLLNVK